MKRILYTGILLALTFVLILSIFPVSAQAANQEDVLTAVSHTAAVSADVSAEHDTVTLTVPNQFTGDVDLSAGLDIAYNTAVYASASAGFPEGATAVVDGSAVKMLVTYLRKDEPVLYAAQYLSAWSERPLSNRLFPERFPSHPPCRTALSFMQKILPTGIHKTMAVRWQRSSSREAIHRSGL